MSHTTLRSGYEHLVDRLNRFPQGAPPSETLFKILALLFSEREAELVALLPIKPFTVETAARAWKMDTLQAQKVWTNSPAGRSWWMWTTTGKALTHCRPPWRVSSNSP